MISDHSSAKGENRTLTPVTGQEPESNGDDVKCGNSRVPAGFDEHWNALKCALGEDCGGARQNPTPAVPCSATVRRRLYFVWRKMVLRCTEPRDPGYHRYGARGIGVSLEWLLFARFLADMAPTYRSGLTLERQRNDAGYSPGNCVWADRFAQQANTRKTLRLTFEGETLPVREWSRRTGIHHSVIARRIHRGLSPAEALGRRSIIGDAL